jgi:hypothetical protein
MSRSRWRFFAITTVLCAIVSSKSLAGICLPSDPDPKADSSYHYLLALTDALNYAKTGRDRVRNASDNPDTMAAMTELMINIKLADKDYSCAADILKPYLASSNKAIATSAEAAATVFDALVQLDKQSLAMLKNILNNDPNATNLGDLAERLSDLGAQADDIWKLLPMATISATYSIIEKDPATQKMSRLNITALQRTEVLSRLKGTFGPSILKGMQAGQLPLEGAAGALCEFLTDTRWRPKEPSSGASSPFRDGP